MPELPDITVYIEALEERILGQTLDRIMLNSPFLLRSLDPPLQSVEGQQVRALRRIGKRIAIGFNNDVWLVLHLMIAGRLHWGPRKDQPLIKRVLASFNFANGSLTLTEAGTQHRASLTLTASEKALADLDPGGIEPLDADLASFAHALTDRNHTLKRALTDPRLFSGIGNAYSDEILHKARLSPVALTQKLTSGEIARLHAAVRETLQFWIGKLRDESAGDFPEKVTAFRPGMAMHGRYKEPCPDCGTKVQRIRYAANQTNYCPTCQTGGKLLADRGLSRLLRQDWPRTADELELLKASKTVSPP